MRSEKSRPPLISLKSRTYLLTMAGKNHHHLWQMLQRGFADRDGKQHITFAYGKLGDPERKNTKDFGAEEFFYGPEGSAADENITDFELRMERHIQALRRAPDGHQVDSAKMAALVSHLEMRSFFLRSEMIRVSDEMLVALQHHLSSPSKTIRLMSTYLENHPELVAKEIDKLNLQPEGRALAEAYADSKLPSLIEQAAPGLAKQAAAVFGTMGPAMIKAAKEGHIKALENDFFTVERVGIHSQWSFFVKRYNGERLILPDTALAFLGKTGCSPLSQKGSNFQEVIVPVSDQVALIGCSKKPIFRTSDAVNRILASCSYQGFAAREDLVSLRKLARRIGKNAELISKSELRRIFSFDAMLDRL